MLRCYAVTSVVTSSAKPAAVPRAPGDPDCNYHHQQQPGVVEGETWSSFVSHSADTQPAAYFRQPGEMTLIPWNHWKLDDFWDVFVTRLNAQKLQSRGGDKNIQNAIPLRIGHNNIHLAS